MVSLSSLPFDVLLVIFQDLDVVNVIRTGMTCRDLYQATQYRHVWVDQLNRLRQEDPVIKPATPPLASLSTKELKRFVTGRTRLLLRWNEDESNLTSFVAKGTVGIPRAYRPVPLPGGKFLLVIDDCGSLVLHRIQLEGGRVSLPVVAKIKSNERLIFEPGEHKLLTTTSPCPIFVCAKGNKVQIVRVDHHNCAMSIETSCDLPEGFDFVDAAGQGRVVGLLVRDFPRCLRAIIIHLDHLGVTLESEISPLDSYPWSICIPTESRAVIFDHVETVLTCAIPGFSSLPPGINHADATLIRSQSGSEEPYLMRLITVPYMESEALYGPHSAREFDLYYLERSFMWRVTTLTIPIDPGDNQIPIHSTTVPLHVLDPDTPFFHKRLYFYKSCEDDGALYLVAPLKDFALRDQVKVLRMFVSREEFEKVLDSEVNEIDVDEATGRVIIWRWDSEAQEVKLFVGDLV